MLSRRIGDQSLLRLIQKWLKAGVLDTDGKVSHPLTGTPQGGIVSQLAAAQSRVIHFSRNGEPGSSRFDFLGFEFTWGNDRAGKPHVKRRTSRKKLRNSLANFTARSE